MMTLTVEQRASKELVLETEMNLYLLNSEMDYLKKKYEDTEYENNIWSKIKNNIVGSQKDYDKYKQAKDKYLKEIEKAKEYNVTSHSIEDIKELCNELFEGDETYNDRVLFAINVILSLNHNYSTNVVNAAFKEFSTAMNFKDSLTFTKLQENYKTNWISINLGSNYDNNNALVAGLICLPLAAIATGGIIGLVGGTSLVGGLMTGLVTGMAIAGTTATYYVVKEQVDRRKLLEQYKKLTPEETSYFLAMNVTILKFLEQNSGKETEDYKERMKFIIEYENEIHNDYFVENINENDDNKNKVRMLQSTLKLVQKGV